MKKTLVVFHSYTGNTKMIANEISKQTGADVFELEPVKPFSDDYQTVVDEYQNNSIKEEVEIKPVTVNINDYENIVVCSPVWWYTITPVISTFLKQTNLENKNVYAVATNAGWIGHTFGDIKKLCPKSNIKNCANLVFDEDFSKHKLNSGKKELDDLISSLKND